MSLFPAPSNGAALAMPARHNARDNHIARSAKSLIACDRCRLKKTKCEQTRKRSRGPARNKGRPQSLEERLKHAQRLLRKAGLGISDFSPLVASTDLLTRSNSNSSAADASAPVVIPAPAVPAASTTASAAASTCSPAHTQYLHSPPSARAAAPLSPDSTSTPAFHVDLNAFASLLTPSGTSNCPDPHELPPPAQGPGRFGPYSPTTFDAPASVTIAKPGTVDENRRVDGPVNELLGPSSFLSICLEPGMGWIASRIHASSFRTSAPSMLSTISNKLQLNERLVTERMPDPDRATAWTYVRAYFDESLEATFCLVDRSSFETRLRNHFDNPIRMDDDPAWYGTRNTVYAIGCKIHTFKSRSWSEAQEKSKTYFKNALAVEADLLHGGGPGLTSIQALFLMAIFAEGCGSPKIEYMLIGCTLRLSHAKGLHLRPSSSRLAQADVQKRSWLFWSIYCYEKHLAMRVGGPSLCVRKNLIPSVRVYCSNLIIIDDDNISCDLPTLVQGVSPNIVEFFKQSIRQATISSDILKNFTTVKAQQVTPLQKMKLVKDMDERLKNWYDELPQHFKGNFHAPSSQIPEGLRIEHLMYLHLTYHANMSAIHSIFGYPWNLSTSQNMSQPAIQEQAAASAKVLAQSSSAIILAIRSISIDSVAPVWLVFYFPLIGMINLFISVLRAPEGESAMEGIGLLEMAAGHFAYLEYATQSAVSIPCIRSLAHWAREAVSKNLPMVTPREQSDNPCLHEEMASLCQQDNDAELPHEIYDFAADPFTVGEWPAFLPRLSQIDSWF
ncbi:hypothetical protein IQ07DRAFT_596528 [Pyrenochaeta sp. DS3sAY3a]|nr:hypothetical protein IQ07DRAFT_596528 [Pyrenochaeta sp. DS3sAY3a]